MPDSEKNETIYALKPFLGSARASIGVIPSHIAWPRFFRVEKVRIEQALPFHGDRLEHIGSTAVAGLPAEPILDLLIGFGGGGIAAMEGDLRNLGYRLETPPEGLRPTLFTLAGARDFFTHFLWAAEYGGESWNFALQVRDFLLRDPRLRAEFAAEKKLLAKRFAEDRPAYQGAKWDWLRDRIQ